MRQSCSNLERESHRATPPSIAESPCSSRVRVAWITRSVYLLEDAFERLPIHWMWWPALGAVVVGVIGYLSPRTLGVGYDNIQDILAGTITGRALLVLVVLKLTSWAIALSSGTSGGTLAPLFIIGGVPGLIWVKR